MSWLDEHIETFVEPTLGRPFDRALWHSEFFSTEELTVIKNAWRAIKKNAKGKMVLLPGRDVFIFEILARREGYPTTFVPECSRMTVNHMASIIPNIEDYYLFDTGFAGTIPRVLKSPNSNWQLLSAHQNDSKQVFPRLTLSRGLALNIEGTPKYWESGRMDGTNPIQHFSNPTEFERAARLTVEIYTNSARKFVNKHQPLGGGRAR